MAQKYELNDTDDVKYKKEVEAKRNRESEEGSTRGKDEPLGDVFDVYGMVSKVHSRITGMTRDYVLAQYTSDVINSKFPKFIREQRKTLRVIKSFLIIPLIELRRRYNEQHAMLIYKSINKVYQDIEELLLGELDEMVIISRAGRGQVTKAMLLHGRNREEREEFDAEIGGKGVGEKLMEKSK